MWEYIAAGVSIAVVLYLLSQKRNKRRSSLSQTNIPKFRVSDLDQPDKVALFRKWMIEEGFVVITLDDEIQPVVTDYIKYSREFFAEDIEYKKGFKGQPKYKDELDMYKERQVNKGFLVLDHKEFLKLSLTDPTQKMPDRPEQLGGTFKVLCENWEGMMKKFLKIMLDTTEPETGKPYSKDYSAIMEFVGMGSSVSIIDYHAIPKNEAKYASSDKATDDNHFPSATHFDTGLLTFIMCSSVPALQIQDRVTKEWFMPEKICTPGRDAFLIIGTKLKLLSSNGASKFIPPTLHRVCLPYETQRNSLLYFMDLPT